MGISTFELPKNINDNYLDMSGWVDVEMPGEERNRIGSKGLERIDELAEDANPGNAPADSPRNSSSAIERMMAIAVRETDRAASAEALRNALKLDLGETLSGDRKKLDFCRLAACNALKDLDSLTGREIASFAAGQSNGDAKVEHVRALLNDAVKAQEKYADELKNYCNKLKLAEDDSQRMALMQLADRSLARADKIKDLWTQLRNATHAIDSANDAVGGNAYDKALLDRRGFADRIYLDEAKNDATLKMIDQKAKPTKTDVQNYFAAGGTSATATRFSELNIAYAKARYGVQGTDLQTVVARNYIDGLRLPNRLKLILDDTGDLLKTDERLKKGESVSEDEKFLYEALNESIEKSPFNPQGEGRVTLESFNERIVELRTAFNAYKGSLERYVDAATSNESGKDLLLETAQKEVNDKIADLKLKAERLKVVCRLGVVGYQQSNDYSRTVKTHLKGLLDELSPHWDLEFGNIKRLCAFEGSTTNVFFDKEDELCALFEGSRRISTLIEAKVWGEDGLHDAELEGKELVKVEDIGSGLFNSAKLCTFVGSDGSKVQRVFRADNGARRSVASGAISSFFYKVPSDVSGFSYSHASGVVARQLGCEDIFPKTTFGALDGQPGMFLEVAPGETGRFFWNNRTSAQGHGPLKDIQKSPQAVAGEVARKLNRLQWLDFLTGQIDRHVGNLMIGKGDDDSVSVKGIDNDECFPEISIGNGLLVFKDEQQAMEEMLSRPRPLCDNVSPSDFARGRYQASLKEPLKTMLAEKYVFDVNKLDLKARVEFIDRHNNYGLPDRIDKKLYDKIKETTPNHLARLLKKAKLTPEQILAAKARLVQMQAKIEELKNSGKVMEEDDWKDIGNLKEIYASAQSAGIRREIEDYNRSVANRSPGRLDDQIVSDDTKAEVEQVLCDYYARIGFHEYIGLPVG